MTARSIGSTTLMFGKVAIPVRIYSTKGEERKLSFNRLHRDCPGPAKANPENDSARPAARLKQSLSCTVCEAKGLEDEQLIKGYEHAKGQYVTFEASELDAIDAVSSEVIALADFIPASELEPLYVDKSYYLGAEPGAESAMAVLWEAMTCTERVGVATWSTKGRQSVVAIRIHPEADTAVLLMHELRYQHEVRPVSEVPGSGALPNTDLVQLAVAYIEQEACNVLDLGKFADVVYERQKALVDAKVASGQVIGAPAPDAAPATTGDLMSALRASVKEPIAAPVAKPAKRSRVERASSAAKKRTKAAKKTAARKPTKKAVPSAMHYAKRR